MIRIALAALLLAFQPLAGLYSTPQQRVVLPDGRRINLVCSGEGGPVVLLNGGLGLPSMVWSRVQPIVASTNRVCVYDRPGYGFSDAGPLPRTARRNAEDLHAALTAAELKPPYVLVGHSRGGFDVRVFADRYRRETLAMVLVDANFGDGNGPPAAMDGRELACIRAAAAGRMKAGEPMFEPCGSPPPGSAAASAAMAQAVLSEMENVPADERETSRITPYGGLPLVVLTAADHAMPGQSPEAAAAEQRKWMQGHAALARLSSRGEHRPVPNARHVIQMEKPEVVAQAIADVIRRAR